MIEIYTDGACSSTDKTGGWAVIVKEQPLTSYSAPYCEEQASFSAYFGHQNNTTNNEMELVAILNALQLATAHFVAPITIYTDSAYIANCFRDKWYATWMKNGWRTARKTEVEHKQLWAQIVDLYTKLGCTVIHVRAHKTNHYNNLADTYAVKARLELREDNAEKYACRDN